MCHVNHEQPRPLRLKAVSIVIARTATEDSPLVGASGRELHHHDVETAGIGLAVKVSAITVPADNNGVSTAHLCRLGLGRKSTYLLGNV